MVRCIVALALAVVLLAPSAVAEEPDAETRFHDAYVLEVIDGEIAEAAKAYLALVGDEEVPARIRDESRFRFAICTVLLGRPDEGRIQLAAIVENERAPASLRKQAQAYLESISALGVGTELERKLNSLVFDLGRANPRTIGIPAYRDFEIIGKPAIPFLERLLQHEDVNLRRHAFRLLIRLGAKDLVARWTPQIDFAGQGFNRDFVFRYLDGNPDELPRLEAKLLTLDDETLHGLLTTIPPYPEWSLDFVRALVVREKLLDYGFAFLDRSGAKADQWDFARTCILGDAGSLRHTASRWAVSQPDGPPEALAQELWPGGLRGLAGSRERWYAGEKVGTVGGNLVAWAKRVPVDLLLGTLTELVDLGEAAPGSGAANPLLHHQLASLIAHSVGERKLDAKQLDTFDGLVRRWTSAIAPTLEGGRGHYDANPVARPLRNVVERLPADRAASFVGWLFRGPAHERAEWFDDVVRVERPEDVPLLVEAVRAAEPKQRAMLLRRLRAFTRTSPSAEIVQAELDALPVLLKLTSLEAMDGRFGHIWSWSYLVNALGRVPDAALVRMLKELFETAAAQDERLPQRLFDLLVDFRPQLPEGMRQRTSFLARCVLPALDAQAEALQPAIQRHVLDKVLLTIRHRYGFEEGDKERVAAWILRHEDDLEAKDLDVLVAHPDLFPLEDWLPGAPLTDVFSATHRLPWKDGQVDAAMRVLTADVTKIDDTVLYVLVGRASPEVAQDVIDRMLASDDPTLRHRALGSLRDRTGYPASPAGLEAALAGLLASDDADLGDLAKVALLLAQVQPSEKLLPAAEGLLASEEKKDVLQGIQLAGRLGHESLVPALARLLDSLDSGLRDRAKAAIQAIQELKRLREETEQPR